MARDLISKSVRYTTMTPRNADFMRATAPMLNGLYAAAVRLTRSPAEADDIVQETMLSAWQAWDRFEAGTNLRAWLHRIMVNGYISQYRRRKREARALDMDVDPTRRDLLLTDAQRVLEGADGGVVYHGVGTVLREALDALPEDFRSVIVLSDLCDLSYREIADALECPIGTVMSRLHRARRAVASHVAERCPEEASQRMSHAA
jgi:RNA polymerase sigma-70 factor, ECF subfamily